MFDDTNERQRFALPGARPQYGPDKLVAVEAIALHLTPDFDSEAVDGVCTLTVRAFDEPVPRLVLDAVDLQVKAVDQVGPRSSPLNFKQRDGTLEIDFDPAIDAGEETAFAIRYRVERPRHGLFFIKPTAAHPEKIAHLWTQSQDQYARYWFPCLDYPHEKQRTETTIVVPKGMFALGNGELLERKEENGKTLFRYRQEVPHSTYLVTMVAGPFVESAQGKAGRNGVPVFYYVLPGREAEGARSFGKTPKMIECFEGKLGTPYPYARYSQIAVSDFIFGGMENTAATTQTDRTLHDETARARFFERSARCTRARSSVVRRSADLSRLGPRVAQRRLCDVYGSCLARSRSGLRRVSLRRLYRVDRIFERGSGTLPPADRLQHVHRADRDFRPASLPKGRGRFAHASRRARRCEVLARRRALRRATTPSDRSRRSISFVRSKPRPGATCAGFSTNGSFARVIPSLKSALQWDAKLKTATITIDQKQPIDTEHPPYEFDVEVALAPARRPDQRTAYPRARRARARNDRGAARIRAGARTFRSRCVSCSPTSHISSAPTAPPPLCAAIRASSGGYAPLASWRKTAVVVARDAIEEAFASESFWGVLAGDRPRGRRNARAVGDYPANSCAGPFASESRPGGCRGARELSRRGGGNGAHRGRAEARSYFVRAAALTALGKTRDPRAFDVLASASAEKTWNGIVEGGAMRGLGELADARAMPLVLDALAPESSEGLRRAAVTRSRAHRRAGRERANKCG